MSSAVFQINWICAHARQDRWKEQLKLVTSHMSWTIATFQSRKETWQNRAVSSAFPGPKSYALQHAAMWEKFALEAGDAFARTKNKLGIST